MDKKNENGLLGKVSFSRRTFLKGGAVTTGGLLFGGLAAGCSDSNNDNNYVPPVRDTSYDVVDTDILFIGGGIGALTGIYEAISAGRKVTVVDKGPWRAGGASGYNWDLNVSFVNDEDGAKFNWTAAMFAEATTKATHPYLGVPYHCNMKLGLEAFMAEKNQEAPLFFAGIGGESFPRRNADGSFKWDLFNPLPPHANATGNGMTDGGFPRHVQDFLTQQSNVTIKDCSMVTNIIEDNGRCVGVTALHLPTGKYTLYKANAVILTAGGCVWWAGWETVSPLGSSSPDNTADVEMALFRRGCGIGDAEYAQYDYTTASVSGFVGGYNLSIGGDCTHPETIMDKDGYNYWKDYLPAGTTITSTQDLQLATAKFMHEHPEKLGPTGGVFIGTASPDEAVRNVIRRIYNRNYWIYKKAGINPEAENVEAHVEMWEHGGTPIIDNDLMTEKKGIFNQRGSGATAEMGGMVVGYNRRFSQHAARKAVEFINSNNPAVLNLEDAQKELDRLEEIRNRAGTLRPFIVRKRIQKACEPVCGIIREKDKLLTAKAELERIRREDMPQQTCVDKSRLYNIEWKQAIENYNLLDMAELFVGGSLAREESRTYLRPDFPNRDDVNFHCSLVGNRKSDGSIEFTKRKLPTLDWGSDPFTSPVIPPNVVEP